MLIFKLLFTKFYFQIFVICSVTYVIFYFIFKDRINKYFGLRNLRLVKKNSKCGGLYGYLEYKLYCILISIIPVLNLALLVYLYINLEKIIDRQIELNKEKLVNLGYDWYTMKLEETERERH